MSSPQHSTANNNNNGFFNALVRGLISLWIIGAGLAAQCLVAASANLLPLPVAALGGVWANLFVLPAMGALLLGICGLPNSWWTLLRALYDSSQGNSVVEKLAYMAGQIFQLLVFRPFPCPPSLQNSLPAVVKLFLFREPERLIPPPAVQLRQAPVKDEYWIFVNGVTTTTAIAKSNADLLFKLFGRPIWTCYTPTDGIFVDILECIVDKIGWGRQFWKTKPRATLLRILQQALTQAQQGVYTRVVVVAHSQGTIITAQVLKDLLASSEQWDNGNKTASRQFLQVFCLADCAHQMIVRDAQGIQSVNFLENLTNRLDAVAWLGVLFPFPSFWEDQNGRGIVTEGSKVVEPFLFGHFLNTHYLEPLAKGAYPFSRLNAYRNGQKPPAPLGLYDPGRQQRSIATSNRPNN